MFNCKKAAPWGKLFTSVQFWAIGVQYFITDYIMFVFFGMAAALFNGAHGFSLAKNGHMGSNAVADFDYHYSLQQRLFL